MISQLGELRQILLAAYKRFAKFCVDNDIKFFAAGGTALGAVRHKGFIPWDDDMDLYILPSEYQKLKRLRHLMTNYDLELYLPGDKNYRLFYPKIGIPNTTCFETLDYDLSIGVTIDIFPLYDVAGTLETIDSEVQLFNDYWNKYLTSIKRFSLGFYLKNYRKSVAFKCIFKHLYYKSQKRVFLNRWVDFCNTVTSQTNRKVTTFTQYFPIEKEIFEKEWFSDSVLMQFEDTMIPMPIGYDDYLKTHYGDYMTPPPVNKRESTHSIIFLDLNHKYSLAEVMKLIERDQ